MKKTLLSVFGYLLFVVLAASTIYAASPKVEEDASGQDDQMMMEDSKEDNAMMEDNQIMEDEKMNDEEGKEMTDEGMMEQKEVDYDLPYPGILPNHPLYFLKQFRDNVLDFLIRDPLKRSEFNLLMADKRINMANFLANKGEYKMAEEISSEAEQYYTKAVDELTKAEEQGREITNELVEKLSTASRKHRQVISDLEKSSPEEVKQGYQKVLETISQAEANLQNIGK